MKLKNEYIFLITNYAIFIVCWIIFKSGIILKDNIILEIIGLINLLVHTILIFGGEALIYFIFSFKNDLKLVLKLMLISLLINIFINIVTNQSILIIYVSINQIIGFIVGRICYNRHFKKN